MIQCSKWSIPRRIGDSDSEANHHCLLSSSHLLRINAGAVLVWKLEMHLKALWAHITVMRLGNHLWNVAGMHACAGAMIITLPRDCWERVDHLEERACSSLGSFHHFLMTVGLQRLEVVEWLGWRGCPVAACGTQPLSSRGCPLACSDGSRFCIICDRFRNYSYKRERRSVLYNVGHPGRL